MHPTKPLLAFVPITTWPTTFFSSSWIFAVYDRNSSEPDAPLLDLTGLPTTPRAELEPKLQGSGLLVPQAATALVCEPQIEVYTAEVTLNKGTLHAVRIDHPPIGNMDSRFMLRNQFVSSLIPDLAYNFPDSIHGISSNTFSSVARLLLFCAEDSTCDTSFRPFPIPTINENMNRFFRSASKAFLDGYNGTRPGVYTLSVPNFNTFTTKSVGQADEMALVASRPFFISLVVILALATLLLGILCLLLNPDHLLCFNLDNISRLLLDELEHSNLSRSHASPSSLTLHASNTIERIDSQPRLRSCRTSR